MHLVVPPGGCFRETRRIELGPQALVLGRAEACDIRVDVPGVDDEHAKISEMALIAIGADCAIGDVPLDAGARRLITPGDEIQIGSVVVALDGDDEQAVKDEAEGEALGRKRITAPCIRVVEGATANFGEELVLKEENREYFIGRGPKCDLSLEDREVSREHVKLIRRGFMVYIQDLTSTRGSWLGRSSVYTSSPMEWARPRMLRVGQTVLSLELPREVRSKAPPPLASAPMTPPPRAARSGPPGAPSTPSPPSASQPPPPVSAPPPRAIHPYAYDPTLPPQPVPMVPAAMGSSPPTSAVSPSQIPANRTAWKKSSGTVSRTTGLILLAVAAVAILGALFVVFSLLE